MSELLGAMALIIATWAGLYLIFSGLGLLIRRSFGLRVRDTYGLVLSFWMGWAFVIGILQLWHLEFPVDSRVFLLVSLIGVGGLCWNWKDVWHLTRKTVPEKWVFFSVLLLAALWLANQAIDAPHNYDSGLYHLASVQWAQSYPIVPGLGNLHGRLAFNSPYFLYVAMLDFGPWFHKSHHLANGILLLVLFAQILLSAFKLLREKDKCQVYDLFHVVLLTPVLSLFLSHNVSSPSPDLPIFVLGIVLFACLLHFLVSSRDVSRENEYAVFVITTIAVVGTAIKLNFTVLGIGSSILAISVWIVRNKSAIRTEFRPWRTLSWITVSMAMIVGPWMMRGVMLSGYIAYPSTMGSFPVEWRIPRESVVDMANWIRTWAIKPNVHWSKVLGNWDWLGPWALRMSRRYFDVVIPLFLAVVGGLTLIYHHVRNYGKRIQVELWLLLFVPIASLVFWFVASANPRYASVWFWLLGAGAMSIMVGTFGDSKRPAILHTVLSLSICLSVIPLIKRDKFIGPGGNSGFYITRSAEVETFITRSGLLVYVPLKGDQCWDAPLPCTPHPNAELRLRKEGDMTNGFMLETKGR